MTDEDLDLEESDEPLFKLKDHEGYQRSLASSKAIAAWKEAHPETEKKHRYKKSEAKLEKFIKD